MSVTMRMFLSSNCTLYIVFFIGSNGKIEIKRKQIIEAAISPSLDLTCKNKNKKKIKKKKKMEKYHFATN
jgi:hypothetical protein